MQNDLQKIQAAFLANDTPTICFPSGDGQLLISPHAARILACDLSSSGLTRNLFYHHPDLESPESAKEILAGCVMAGDRLWIAPEVAYMWPSLELARKNPLANYQLNPDMDPGRYEIIEQQAKHIVLSNTINLIDNRNGKRISLRTDRQFNSSETLPELPADIKSLAFTITNRLELLDGDQGALAGGWDILQVPADPPGTLICPTLQPVSKPRGYYDPFKNHVQCDGKAVRFRIDADNRIKMGLLPTETTGRMGYYQHHPDINLASAIIRIFNTLPGEPYCDLPRSSDDILGGDVLQAYNDDLTHGCFGEMEYHDPALVVGRPWKSRQSTSTTHVLVGPDEEIKDSILKLLALPDNYFSNDI